MFQSFKTIYFLKHYVNNLQILFHAIISSRLYLKDGKFWDDGMVNGFGGTVIGLDGLAMVFNGSRTLANWSNGLNSFRQRDRQMQNVLIFLWLKSKKDHFFLKIFDIFVTNTYGCCASALYTYMVKFFPMVLNFGYDYYFHFYYLLSLVPFLDTLYIKRHHRSRCLQDFSAPRRRPWLCLKSGRRWGRK